MHTLSIEVPFVSSYPLRNINMVLKEHSDSVLAYFDHQSQTLLFLFWFWKIGILKTFLQQTIQKLQYAFEYIFKTRDYNNWRIYFHPDSRLWLREICSQAAREGDLERVQEILLLEDADPNSTDPREVLTCCCHPDELLHFPVGFWWASIADQIQSLNWKHTVQYAVSWGFYWLKVEKTFRFLLHSIDFGLGLYNILFRNPSWNANKKYVCCIFRYRLPPWKYTIQNVISFNWRNPQ